MIILNVMGIAGVISMLSILGFMIIEPAMEKVRPITTRKLRFAFDTLLMFTTVDLLVFIVAATYWLKN